MIKHGEQITRQALLPKQLLIFPFLFSEDKNAEKSRQQWSTALLVSKLGYTLSTRTSLQPPELRQAPPHCSFMQLRVSLLHHPKDFTLTSFLINTGKQHSNLLLPTSECIHLVKTQERGSELIFLSENEVSLFQKAHICPS